MQKYGSFMVLLLCLSLAVASCAASSPVGQEIAPDDPNPAALSGPGSMFDGMPAFPVEEGPAPQVQKGLSWIYNVDPQTPILQHRAAICTIHPGCMMYMGLYDMPLTHMPPPPYFAYGMYQVPLGASAPDLETMKLTGAMSAAGESYYIALANWSANVWEWFGPAGTTPDYTIDFTTLGYDYSSPWGNMYFVVIVPQHNTLHLWDIELEFKDTPGEPGFWNVWGKAYDVYSVAAAPTVLPGETVSFEDQLTGVVYTATTAADGAWGLNLPDGFFKFNVTNSLVLFDLAAFLPIDNLPVTLEVNAGNIIYHGPNTVYDGTTIPMPLYTVNIF